MAPKHEGLVAIVDDDKTIVESISDLMASAGYMTISFSSAQALLECGALYSIGCLISDICMPEIDGLQLLSIVRTNRPQLPVVLMTAYDSRKSDVAGNLRNGEPVQMLIKPFDPQLLVDAVEKALGNAP